MAKAKEVIPVEDLTPEERYAKAQQYYQMAETMRLSAWQEKYYNKGVAALKMDVDEYPESKKLWKYGRTRVSTIRSETRIRLYREACEARDAAKTEEDWDEAAKKFQAVNEYFEKRKINEKLITKELKEGLAGCQDVDDQIRFCQEKHHKLQLSRRTRKLWITAALAVVVILGALFTRTAVFQRVLGHAEQLVGDDTRAWARYKAAWQKTGSDEDHETYLTVRYADGVAAWEKGDIDTAYSDFKVLAEEEDYLDSGKYFAACEQQRLAAAEIGAKVTFGGMDWYLLERDGSKVLLLKNKACSERAFDASGDAVTWENSEARAWLNSEFMTNHFTEAEQSLFVPTEVENEANPEYGTGAGAATTDQLFLLSAQEVSKYNDLLKTTNKSWWTRTSGAVEGSMVYVNNEKAVILFGDDTSDINIRLKPAAWIETAVDAIDLGE